MRREVVLSLSGTYTTDMERSHSDYMPRLIDDFEFNTNALGNRCIPDDGVDTWFLTGSGWYENRHFPYMNLMRDEDDGELRCLLWHDKLRDLYGPIFLPMDALSLICDNRKTQLQWFHKDGLNAPRIDPAPVD